MKNLVIQHLGMGFPIGAVVPPTAFPHGYAGHIALGAVAETTSPCTHAVDLPDKPAAGEAEAQNGQLRSKIVELEGRIAGLLEERTGHLADIERLGKENLELHELLDSATAQAADAQAEAFNANNAGTAPELPPIS